MKEKLTDYLRGALAKAEAAVPGLAFIAEVGLSYDKEQGAEDESSGDDNVNG